MKILKKPNNFLPTQARVFPPLPTLDHMLPLADAATHLEANQGRYVLFLETLVNEAAKQGMLDQAKDGVQFLLRLTPLGTKRTSTKIEVRQLRDEYDLTKVDTEKLWELLGRNADGSRELTDPITGRDPDPGDLPDGVQPEPDPDHD